VSHPTDTLIGRIRIDVEPADSDQPPTAPGAEQRFAGPVKLIRAAGPLLDEPTDEPETGLLAFSKQGSKAVDRQVLETFNERGHVVSLPPKLTL